MSEQHREGEYAAKRSDETEDKHELTHAPAGSRWILGLEFVDLAHCAFPFAPGRPGRWGIRHIGASVRRPGQLREFRDFASLPCERFAFSTMCTLPALHTRPDMVGSQAFDWRRLIEYVAPRRRGTLNTMQQFGAVRGRRSHGGVQRARQPRHLRRSHERIPPGIGRVGRRLGARRGGCCGHSACPSRWRRPGS